MAQVYPFKGLRFNQDKLGNIGDLVSLPYDKISLDKEGLYRKLSPYNIVRILLSEGRTSDDRYSDFKQIKDDWVAQDILKQDDSPCFYLCVQKFHVEGQDYVRRSVVGMVKLAHFDEKVILPHEKTLSGPKEDRLLHMSSSQLQLGHIFGFYRCPVTKLNAFFDRIMLSPVEMQTHTLEEDIDHLFWKIDDVNDIQYIQNLLSDEQVMIADGHHRYTTALIYRDQQRALKTPRKGETLFSDYVLMSLTNAEDEGLCVLPTHRILHSVDSSLLDDLSSRLDHYFDISVVSSEEAVASLQDEEVVFSVLCQQGDVFVCRRSDHKKDQVISLLKTVYDDQVVESFYNIQSVLLHQIVFHHLFSIPLEAISQQKCIRYQRGADVAIQSLDEDQVQAVFLLHPEDVTAVMEVCQSGYVMPQKSTDFFPKIYTGFVSADISGEVDLF